MGNYVLDMFTSFTQRFGPLTPLAAYDTTTDTKIDMRSMNDKSVMVKNLGASSLTYTILGSVDSGPDPIEFDLVELTDTAVLPATQNLHRFTAYYAYILIRVSGVGSSAVIKVAGTPN